MVQLDKRVFRAHSKVTPISSTAQHKSAAVFLSLSLAFSLLIPHHVMDIMFGTGASEHMTWPQTETSAKNKCAGIKAVWKF